ncbi:MAG: hypothetical protein M3246_09915 [Actinomycetota bacterium]|nr:hypothetical protein [Actinomycetota bacterium]
MERGGIPGAWIGRQVRVELWGSGDGGSDSNFESRFVTLQDANELGVTVHYPERRRTSFHPWGVVREISPQEEREA